MADQHASNQVQPNRTAKNQKKSGSAYNREHAGNLPDYGMNDVDPNATIKSSMNSQE